MVAIINDAGDSLQLFPGTRLTTEQSTAWLSDDELPGEYSYPLEAPLNENNKRFVSFGYRPDAAVPRSQLPVTVQLQGVLYRRCTFLFRVNDGKLSGYLKIDASKFYDKIRKLTLLEALAAPINLGDGLAGGISLPGRLSQLARLKPGSFPCTFFPLRNEAMLEEGFEDKLTGFTRSSFVNTWEKQADGSFGFSLDLPNAPKFGYLICPQFYLAYVLRCIITDLAGYRIESDWLAGDEIQALTIKNLTAMRVYDGDLGELLTGHNLVPGLFLPDMSVADFLIAIKARFSLNFSYNANTRVCRISQFSMQLSGQPSLDLTPYQTGTYSTELPQNTGYSVSEYVDSADELYRDSTGATLAGASEQLGPGLTPVQLKVGTCQLVYLPSGLSEKAMWLVPSVRQAGNVLDLNYKGSERYLTKEGKRPNSVGLCLLSYRGMSVDSLNNPYPLATPDVRGGQQNVLGTQALGLSGRSGAWQAYLKAYYYFRDQTQRITQRLLLPVSMLAGLELDSLVALTLEDRIRRSYLINKVSAETPGIDGKALVQLGVLSLPPGLELASEPVEPPVWVEFTAGPYTYDANAVNGWRPLSVKLWADATKTKPALVTNLPIRIRVKKSVISSAQNSAGLNTYSEYVQTYYANGSSTVLDPVFQFLHDDLSQTVVHHLYAVAIDPGEGYLILSQELIDHG